MSDQEFKKRITAYVIGFGLSLFTTLIAFALVYTAVFSSAVTVATIIALALAQLLIQLFYFLHLGREAKPRLNGMAFAFMSMVVLIIGLGSLWVMHNLDYNMMPHDPTMHMEKEENINVNNHQHHSH